MNMKPIPDDLKPLFEKIKSWADFGYVNFVDINSTNALGENALHIAVRWNDLDAVKSLIDAGIDVNKHGEHGHTPLHDACSEGHKEIVKLLIDAGANPFARTEGDIPFTLARLSGQDEICDLLSECMRNSPYKPKKSASEQHLKALGEKIEELEDFIDKNCEK